MKKIVFVANSSWSIIKFRLGIIKTLVEQNYQVYVIAPSDEYSGEIISLGCEYIDIKIDNKGSSPIKDIKTTYNLYKTYKRIQPNLIFHYTIKPIIYGSFAAKIGKVKSIAVITGLGYTFINNNLTTKIAKFLYKFSLKFATKVWFINYDDKELFITQKLVQNSKVDILPSEGINTNIFTPIHKEKIDDTFRFLLIARMLWDKGVGEYIAAAETIYKNYQNVEFGLLGFLDVANPQAISKEQMDIWIRNKYIKFYGSSSDVREFIKNADCIVLPSYREGISMTLMESASMEKPLIATNVPGCKDIVDDKENGFLCEVKNPQDLVDKMEKMLNLSQKDREKMGKKGREKMIREFDESIVINKYLQTIKEIL